MHSKRGSYSGLGMDALFILLNQTSKHAMRGIRSISRPRNTSNVWFVPRRPHPERSAKWAFLRVYALTEPITIISKIMVLKRVE